VPGIFVQENQKEMKSPSTSEQSIGARAKWAKIAERLHEFLDPETIEMFNKQEFGESDEGEDEEDENIISDILKTSESVPETTEVENAEILTVLDEHTNQQNIDHTNSSLSNGEDIVQIENQDKNIYCEQKVISNLEVKFLISEGEEMESTLAPDKALEKVLSFDKNSAHEEHCETSLNESEKLTPQEFSPAEHFNIDYFEDPDPTEIEIDSVQPECLKTEQIECNLEILSEDGDVVVKELSVSAQMTFK